MAGVAHGAVRRASPGIAGPGREAGRAPGPSPDRGERGIAPRRAGEEFTARAARLAGMAGAALGWSPETFWRATPAEMAAVVAALSGDDAAAPVNAAALARLTEAFPDG